MPLIPYRKKSSLADSSPFALIEDLQSDLNRFLNNSLLNLSRTNYEPDLMSNWLPNTDIHDAGDRLIIQTDLPGMNKEDIELSVKGNTLLIRGEKKHEEKIKDTGYLKSERFFGHFERALPLTDDVNPERIDASYKNGVLTVTIPKREEALPKQIKVNIK